MQATEGLQHHKEDVRQLVSDQALVRLQFSNLCAAQSLRALVSPAPRSQSQAQEDVWKYQQGLVRAAELSRKAVAPATQKTRDKQLVEFAEWLARVVRDRELYTCIPEDFASYPDRPLAGAAPRVGGGQRTADSSCQQREGVDLPLEH